MNLADCKIESPVTRKSYRVGEFIGADGSLPDDLKGKSLDSIAYIETKKEPRTLSAQSLAPMKHGQRIDFQDVAWTVVRIEGHHFWAIEITP